MNLEQRLDRVETAMGLAPDAQSELARRDRELARIELVKQRIELRERIGNLETARLAAIAEAEKAANALAAAKSTVVEISAGMADAFRLLTNSVPTPLSRAEVENRIAGQISSAMRATGVRTGFLEWPASIYTRSGDWVEAERKALANHLEQLKDQANG